MNRLHCCIYGQSNLQFVFFEKGYHPCVISESCFVLPSFGVRSIKKFQLLDTQYCPLVAHFAGGEFNHDSLVVMDHVSVRFVGMNRAD